MRTTKILPILFIFSILTGCLPKTAKASPIGTVFTYQGRLIDSNYTTNGTFDFKFKLYSDAAYSANANYVIIGIK